MDVISLSQQIHVRQTGSKGREREYDMSQQDTPHYGLFNANWSGEHEAPILVWQETFPISPLTPLCKKGINCPQKKKKEVFQGHFKP